VNLFYCSSSNSNRSFKHFTAEGAEIAEMKHLGSNTTLCVLRACLCRHGRQVLSRESFSLAGEEVCATVWGLRKDVRRTFCATLLWMQQSST